MQSFFNCKVNGIRVAVTHLLEIHRKIAANFDGYSESKYAGPTEEEHLIILAICNLPKCCFALNIVHDI